jgi:hypothetical protein
VEVKTKIKAVILNIGIAKEKCLKKEERNEVIRKLKQYRVYHKGS